MKKLIILSFFFMSTLLSGQVNHWETIVFADDEWSYFVGNAAAPSNWNQVDFDASIWSKGQGGFGYGDGDDNTIIEQTRSVYLTRKFTINSKANIAKMLLDADYDDGYIAYLNGQEVARSNLGGIGTTVFYNTEATANHEASLYAGDNPDRVVFRTDVLEEILRDGENTLAIEVHNVGITSSDLSSNFYLSLGKTDENLEYEMVPSWFQIPVELDFTSSNLPIIILDTENQQSIPDEPKIVAHLGIINNETGRNNINDSFNDYDGQIAIEIRGSSSQWFDKKGYGFETQNADGSNNNVELLGMPAENDWIFHGPFSDKTLIRNAMAYLIAADIMDYAPRVRFCELVINEDYKGVYLLTEKIKRDGDRVAVDKLTADNNSGEELTGGYILKIDKFTGINNDGWNSKYPPGGNNEQETFFQYHYPEADNITAEQAEYIQNYMAEFEDALRSSDFKDPDIGYRKYLDVEAFIRFWMVNEIGKNVDGYRLSTYFHKENDKDGGKLKMGPVWDFNLGFGNADYCTSGNPEGWVFSRFNQVCGNDGWIIHFWWERIFRDPTFREALVNDWKQLRQNELSTERLTGKIDSLQQLLAEAQVRNFNRWDILGTYLWPNYFIGNTHEEEIAWQRNWLIERLDWMDENLDILLARYEEVPNSNLISYPNPFQDAFSIYFTKASNLQIITIKLTDALGRTVVSKPVDFKHILNRYTVDVAGLEELPKGVYFYTLESRGETVVTGKVMKL